MASTVRMLAVGLSLAGNTFALIIWALAGGAVFNRIQTWYSSFVYETPPVIDPQMMQWVFPAFFMLLLVLEVVLIAATWIAIFSKKTYYTNQGY